MPSLRVIFQVLGFICIILAIIGGLMYPMNTMSIFEISAYVVSVSLGISGILFLLYRRGFGEEL
jgi:TRAP-type C4-dicarboxylate transport system permease small subunit